MIVPCFNEAGRLNVPQWQSLIERFNKCHWFFVNDGSTDETSVILNELTGENVHRINLLSNLGKGNAIRAGFSDAINSSPSLRDAPIDFSVIGYIDSDGAFDTTDLEFIFAEAENRLEKVPTCKIIIGSRVKLAGRQIQRNRWRHYTGRLISTIICLGWNNAPYDTQSGFKIFRVDSAFRKVVQEPFRTSWFFDIELILRLEALDSLGIWEVPLLKWDEIGQSSIKFSRYLDIVNQIFIIKSLVRRHLKDRKI